jgi:hypothetical protein
MIRFRFMLPTSTLSAFAMRSSDTPRSRRLARRICPDPDPISAGTAGEAALWADQRGGGDAGEPQKIDTQPPFTGPITSLVTCYGLLEKEVMLLAFAFRVGQ